MRSHNSCSKPRCAVVALPPRSKPSVVMAGAHPLLRPPITLNSGARAPSRKSSQNPAAPDI